MSIIHKHFRLRLKAMLSALYSKGEKPSSSGTWLLRLTGRGPGLGMPGASGASVARFCYNSVAQAWVRVGC